MFLFPCGWWTCTVILFDYFNLSLINSFCISWFSLLLLINSFSIIWLSLLITHYLLLINSFCTIWSSLLFTTLHLSLFLFICSYLLSHISFWMADGNAIYHSCIIIFYSSTLLYYLIITIITLINTFFFTICFCMDDANFTYHPSLIIYYSSTHFLILFFLIKTFPPTLDGWCYVHFHPIVLFRLTFVQFGILSVVSSYAWFIWFYFVLPLMGLRIFHHAHPTL